MKKRFMIALWSVGILYGCLVALAILHGMIQLHRYSIKPIFVVTAHAFIAYISFRYLREELGGPPVKWESDQPLSDKSSEKLRSLWK